MLQHQPQARRRGIRDTETGRALPTDNREEANDFRRQQQQQQQQQQGGSVVADYDGLPGRPSVSAPRMSRASSPAPSLRGPGEGGRAHREVAHHQYHHREQQQQSLAVAGEAGVGIRGEQRLEEENEGLYVSLVLLSKDHQRLARALEEERRARLAAEDAVIELEERVLSKDDELRKLRRALHEEQQASADASAAFAEDQREWERRSEELRLQCDQHAQHVRELENKLRRFMSVHAQIRSMTSDEEAMVRGGSSTTSGAYDAQPREASHMF